jgi:sporulation protein YlmC with PRC-barrel domain
LEKNFLSREKIVGKQVIDENGIIAGTVKDITFDLPRGKMSIIMADDKGKETEISSDNVSAVGDVVLLTGSEKPAKQIITVAKPTTPATTVPSTTPVPAPLPSTKTSSTPGLCSNCNFQNEPESHFCIKCGTKLK